jgi:biopolymer transport protein ExbB/TolQ
VNPADGVIMAGAVVAALTAISIFALKVYRILKRIDSVLGVDRQGRTISDRLDRVEHQLFPNGGSSLTDKINRIEQEQKELKGTMAAFERILNTILRRESERTGRAS